jgi:hypothetical protein
VTTAWARTLDECEARLDAAQTALDAGTRPDVSTFSPDDGPSEPFPAELIDRALALVKRGVELERRLVHDRDDIVSELRRLPRGRIQHSHAESHFELKA